MVAKTTRKTICYLSTECVDSNARAGPQPASAQKLVAGLSWQRKHTFVEWVEARGGSWEGRAGLRRRFSVGVEVEIGSLRQKAGIWLLTAGCCDVLCYALHCDYVCMYYVAATTTTAAVDDDARKVIELSNSWRVAHKTSNESKWTEPKRTYNFYWQNTIYVYISVVWLWIKKVCLSSKIYYFHQAFIKSAY